MPFSFHTSNQQELKRNFVLLIHVVQNYTDLTHVIQKDVFIEVMIWTLQFNHSFHFSHLSGAWSLAFCVFVGPINCLQYEIADCLAKTMAKTGPLLIYATKLGKNIFP